MKTQGGRRKHVPLRTCIACRQKRSKREMIRVVRTPDGSLLIDPKGKHPGRGAYVCLAEGCLDTALEPARLRRALECDVPAEQIRELSKSIEALLHDREKLQLPAS